MGALVLLIGFLAALAAVGMFVFGGSMFAVAVAMAMM